MTALTDLVRDIEQGSGFGRDRRAAIMHAFYLDGERGDEYVTGDGDGVARYGRSLLYWTDSGFFGSETHDDVWTARVAFAVASVPYRLADAREESPGDLLSVDELIAHATGDAPSARCPCCPYGRTSAEVAEVAVAAYLADDVRVQSPDDERRTLDHYMSLAVNGHDDITHSLSWEG